MLTLKTNASKTIMIKFIVTVVKRHHIATNKQYKINENLVGVNLLVNHHIECYLVQIGKNK